MLDVSFSSGQYTHGHEAFYRLPTNYVFHDFSIHYFITSFIVSSSLANQIKSHLYTIPTTSICGSPLVIEHKDDCFKLNQSGWSGIIVNEGLCNSMTESLTISNNNCLQYIYIQTDSLKSVDSLSLSSLPELEWIITDYSFRETTSLSLSSIF